MAPIATSLTQLIGNTPMLEPVRYLKEQGCSARLLLKLECFNPLGSVKDRLALGLIEDAEQQGLLKPGGVIIEPTGGSAGISLAFVGRIHGYRVIITMPDIPGGERRSLLKALGAEVVLTPASRGMQGAIRKAEELAATIPGAYIPVSYTHLNLYYFGNGPDAIYFVQQNSDPYFRSLYADTYQFIKGTLMMEDVRIELME